MILASLFHSTRIKYRLMLWYSLLFAIVLTIAGWVIFSLVHTTLDKTLETELTTTTEAIEATIKTSVTVSIRNHLRAIADKNRDILAGLEAKVERGELSRAEAKRQARDILLSQRIGTSGYIYAITSKGVIKVHPNAEMTGRDMSFHWLAGRQSAQKRGYVEYVWRNPGEVEERAKSLFMSYFEPWDWIISVSSYRNEFLSLLDINDFRAGIKSLQLGSKGYAFVLSGDGRIVLHPRLTGQVDDHLPPAERDLFQRMIAARNGSISFLGSPDGKQAARNMVTVFRYLDDFDWIVASAASYDDIAAPLRQLRNITVLTMLAALVLILPLSLILGASITRPLARLTTLLSKASGHDLPIQEEINSDDEVGILARHFNEYMQRLRRSKEELEGEISDRIHAEQQLKLFAQVFEHALEGISITDAEGTIIEVNEAFTAITGYRRDEAIGQNPRILKSDKHDDAFYEEMWKSLRLHGHWSGEIWNRRKSGEAYPEILSISAIRDAKGVTSQYVAVFHDITEMKRKEEQITFQAYHDALTGLPNRSLARDRLAMALATAKRKRTGIAVLFMDLDNFKTINDSLGHAAGDLLLQEVGRRLVSLVRELDTVARLGGDEFQVISVDIASEQQVVDLAHRVLQGFATPIHIEGQELFITVSIGAAIYPQDGRTAETLTKNADVAMYQAKEKGKNTFSLFTKELTDSSLRRLQLDGEFRQALQRDEFTVYYQPKVEPSSGRVVSVEALVRWLRSDGSIVSPADFIPLAEETGLINPLGELVLAQVCETIQILDLAGYSGIRVAMNLSPNQFARPDLVNSISSALHRCSISPSLLELEITESTMMINLEDSVAKLNLLVEEGISISIDDFGTGYSSLYYLKTFPIHTLKIDRSFVRDIASDPVDAQIVETIILMARNLGISVVAEGVESSTQLELLNSYGCDLIQGYHYSPPLPLEELISYIRAGTGSANGEELEQERDGA